VRALRLCVLPACSAPRFARLGAGLVAQELGQATLVVAGLDGPWLSLGRWQRAAQAVDLPAAARAGLRATRRLGGGRTLVVPPGAIGVLLAVPPGAGPPDETVSPGKALNRYVRGLLVGLTAAGAARGAFYFGRDHVVAEHLQLAALSQDGSPGGTIVVEAIVAVSAPLAPPAELVRYPPHHDARAAGAPWTCLDALAGAPRTFAAVADAIADGFASKTGAALARDDAPPPEGDDPAPPVDEDETGFAASGVADVPIGFVEALARVERGHLVEARLRGDFIAPGFVVHDLEASLAGCALTFEAVAARVDAAFARRGAMLLGVPQLSVLAEALLACAPRPPAT
jgi:hypothetical protein